MLNLFLADAKELSMSDVISTTTSVTAFDPENVLGTQRGFETVVKALENFKASHIKQLKANRDQTKNLQEVQDVFRFLLITNFLFPRP